jgi:succinate dehydrogenase/fumarate reductase-like Fe-S protein
MKVQIEIFEEDREVRDTKYSWTEFEIPEEKYEEMLRYILEMKKRITNV